MRDALSLLTTLGRRGGRMQAGAFAWFPLVGAALGLLLGSWWWVVERAWPRPVAAALVVVADLALTGMLHVDGLADSADGLLPHASPERRLDIMRTPDVGAFGIATVAIVLVLQVAALASRAPSILLLVALWGAARALVASVPSTMHYARERGIASPLLDGAPRWPAATVLVAVALAGAGAGVAGIVAVAAGVLGGVAVLFLAQRRIGGFTGDVLGATIVVTETVGLVVAAARW
ncbi:MAG TPA: adenosylcobinamide-GDP ribazoletransferase [Acidimicrobiia bacterium]|jgi:adenosylcobinamide-GDP ribazoletransferase